MKTINTISLSIDTALNRVPFGTGGGYIRLLSGPTGANVKIHLNDKNADGIPLKTYHAIEASDINNVFISCNAVPGETIKIVQAKTSKDFRMITPASDVNIENIGGYESNALAQLDKIMNPYQAEVLTSFAVVSAINTTLFSKVLTCDKIEVNFNSGGVAKGNIGDLYLVIDGATVFRQYRINDAIYSGEYSFPNEKAVFENVKGKTVTIHGMNNSSNTMYSYIKEYTLKP